MIYDSNEPPRTVGDLFEFEPKRQVGASRHPVRSHDDLGRPSWVAAPPYITEREDQKYVAREAQYMARPRKVYYKGSDNKTYFDLEYPTERPAPGDVLPVGYSERPRPDDDTYNRCAWFGHMYDHMDGYTYPGQWGLRDLVQPTPHSGRGGDRNATYRPRTRSTESARRHREQRHVHHVDRQPQIPNSAPASARSAPHRVPKHRGSQTDLTGRDLRSDFVKKAIRSYRQRDFSDDFGESRDADSRLMSTVDVYDRLLSRNRRPKKDPTVSFDESSHIKSAPDITSNISSRPVMPSSAFVESSLPLGSQFKGFEIYEATSLAPETPYFKAQKIPGLISNGSSEQAAWSLPASSIPPEQLAPPKGMSFLETSYKTSDSGGDVMQPDSFTDSRSTTSKSGLKTSPVLPLIKVNGSDKEPKLIATMTPTSSDLDIVLEGPVTKFLESVAGRNTVRLWHDEPKKTDAHPKLRPPSPSPEKLEERSTSKVFPERRELPPPPPPPIRPSAPTSDPNFQHERRLSPPHPARPALMTTPAEQTSSSTGAIRPALMTTPAEQTSSLTGAIRPEQKIFGDRRTAAFPDSEVQRDSGSRISREDSFETVLKKMQAHQMPESLDALFGAKQTSALGGTLSSRVVEESAKKRSLAPGTNSSFSDEDTARSREVLRQRQEARHKDLRRQLESDSFEKLIEAQMEKKQLHLSQKDDIPRKRLTASSDSDSDGLKLTLNGRRTLKDSSSSSSAVRHGLRRPLVDTDK
eukprot:Blabericola_migrator_1__4268@NODE_2307_length_2964_cov_46_636521_g1444_i0_p1_GENE_NODE_2307_length_2964_cov_46_636521_g1444_i0NODE_2307_length_2964_cov_46_636521_g1444_i0_p1_ORF_typecomplete_len750_score81_29Mulike_Pro/PF10123_9/0_076_NODE_2307_length_2964_cov_46_636521_g1444_i05482797